MTNTLYNNQPTNIYYTTPRSQSTQSTNQITIDGSAILNTCNYMDSLTYTIGSKKQPTNKYMDAILNGNSLNSKFDNNAITTSVNTNLIIYINMIGNIFSQAYDDIVKNNNVINGLQQLAQFLTISYIYIYSSLFLHIKICLYNHSPIL